MRCGGLLRADAERYTERKVNFWTILKLIVPSRGFLSIFFFRFSRVLRDLRLGVFAGLLDRLAATLTGGGDPKLGKYRSRASYCSYVWLGNWWECKGRS